MVRRGHAKLPGPKAGSFQTMGGEQLVTHRHLQQSTRLNALLEVAGFERILEEI